jgi:TolB protein
MRPQRFPLLHPRRSYAYALAPIALLAGAFGLSRDARGAFAASCTPASTKISFVSERSGREQIYMLDYRRPRMVTHVTRLPGFVSYPTWSPDGRRIAFSWLRPGTMRPGIYVADVRGSHVKLLVAQAGSPSWSPDGRLIAYTRLQLKSRGLSVVDVAKALRGQQSATRRITSVDPMIPEEWPAWSPTGKRIAFTSQRTGDSDVWVVDVNGSHLRNLTRNPALDGNATWSPDGSRIVFGSTRDATSQFGGDLYSMNADGSGVKAITTTHKDYGPAWSPDGRWIAFNSQRDGNSELYLMKPDGTDQRRLTRSPEGDAFVTWVGRCRR